MGSVSNLEIFTSVLDDSFCYKDRKALEDTCDDRKGGPETFKMQISSSGGLLFKLYRFDRGDDIFPYFKPESGLKKMCDFILVASKSGRLYVFAIELKKGYHSAHSQLEAAKVFIKFIIDTSVRYNCITTPEVFVGDIRVSKRKIEARNYANMSRRPLLRPQGCPFDKNKHMDYLISSQCFILNNVVDEADKAWY